MDLMTLKDTPPWDWPEGTSQTLLGVLRDERPAETNRLVVAELAGDVTVVDDELRHHEVELPVSGLVDLVDRPDVGVVEG